MMGGKGILHFLLFLSLHATSLLFSSPLFSP